MTLALNDLQDLADETDSWLLALFVASRDEAAFGELVRRHAEMVRATALRICGDGTLAEEVMQNTLLVFARKAHGVRLRHGRNLGPWLHRIAVLEARNAQQKEQRRRKTMQRAIEESEIAEDGAAGDTEPWRGALPHLDEAIDRLSEKDRQLVLMRFFEELPFGAIGAALGGMSADAVRMKTKRAVEKLAKLLRRKHPGVSVAVIASGLAGLGASRTSAACASNVAAELLVQASPSYASWMPSFAGAAGIGWGVRVAAFVVGLGIPVVYSALTVDPRPASSQRDSQRLDPRSASLPRNPISSARKIGARAEPSALERLLEQIARLEDEYQAPITMSEALGAVMALALDELPIVWEAAVRERPPRPLHEAIVVRWAELDPIGSMAACIELGDGLRLASLAMEVWYQADPRVAAEHFRQQPPEQFIEGEKYFWHKMALLDPGLGLQINAELARDDLRSKVNAEVARDALNLEIYQYTLLQGWFRSQGIDFHRSHIGRDTPKNLSSTRSIMEGIEKVPSLNAEQMTGALMWVAMVRKQEDRLGYVDLLVSKLSAGDDGKAELLNWIEQSPIFAEGLRTSLLGDFETK